MCALLQRDKVRCRVVPDNRLTCRPRSLAMDAAISAAPCWLHMPASRSAMIPAAADRRGQQSASASAVPVVIAAIRCEYRSAAAAGTPFSGRCRSILVMSVERTRRISRLPSVPSTCSDRWFNGIHTRPAPIARLVTGYCYAKVPCRCDSVCSRLSSPMCRLLCAQSRDCSPALCLAAVQSLRFIAAVHSSREISAVAS